MTRDSFDHPSVNAYTCFNVTQWSLIMEAKGKSSPQQLEALNQLCQTYRPAVLAYVRRRGYRHEQAEDLTQDFFQHLLGKKAFTSVDRAKGKFRSFLLASLRHFMANEWDKQHAAKRGGDIPHVPLQATGPDGTPGPEPADPFTPDQHWDRAWAATVTDKAWQQLKGEYAARGQEKVFEALQTYSMNPGNRPTYAALAARLEMTEAAVKMAAGRLSQRLRELIEQVIAATVNSDEQLQEELRHLREVWRGGS
jgi:RNA polymerase sigma-70 factor (ECF subfamily)